MQNHAAQVYTAQDHAADAQAAQDPDAAYSDAIVTLEDGIIALAAEIEEAVHRLLTLLARFDRMQGWEQGGFMSCAHWLAARCGMDLGAAREKVRTARALEELPCTSGALAEGRITYSQARALTRVATPEDEAELLDLSEGFTTAQVERLVRGWRLATAEDEVAREEIRQQARRFSVVPDLDGMYRVQGRLTPEQGALLMRAIDRMGDLLFREGSHGAPYETPPQMDRLQAALPGGTREVEVAAARRRADALALLAEVALNGGWDAEAGEGCAAGDRGEAGAERGGAGGAAGAGDEGEVGSEGEGTSGSDGHDFSQPLKPREAPISGSSAGRYQVLLHVDLDALESREGAPASASESGGRGLRSTLEDGIRVSQETSRRRCCDAAVVPVGTNAEGEILNLGQRIRTVNPALRRALDARDRGCRFPGCGKRYTEAHHIVHWADGGETSLTNCLLLCHHHHRLVHEGGWAIRGNAVQGVAFISPAGGVHVDGRWQVRRPPPSLARPSLRSGGGASGEGGAAESAEAGGSAAGASGGDGAGAETGRVVREQAPVYGSLGLRGVA